MNKLEVRLARNDADARSIGTLAEQRGTIFFEWDAAYLRDGIELSPFKLPRAPGLHEHRDPGFGPLPGLFDQSLPDGWGLLLMDRHFRREGVEPAAVSPLSRLAYLGTRTMGALTYHPCAAEPPPTDVDLFALGRNAEDVFAGQADEVLPELMRAGGSPGGARPKVLVGLRGDALVTGDGTLPVGYEPWMVKFAAKSDAAYAGPVEYAYSLMARAAGVSMPDTRLFEVGTGRNKRCFFGVRRFDRQGGRRLHVQSLANLLNADFRIPSLDYAQLMTVTSRLTGNHADVVAAFRQMVFNVAAHVRDDHGKNFAFFVDADDEWRLTPAYDLTFTEGPGGEHSTTVNGEGKQPTVEDCLAIAELAGIRRRDAAAVFDDVNAAVARWDELADQAGCPRAARRTVAENLGAL